MGYPHTVSQRDWKGNYEQSCPFSNSTGPAGKLGLRGWWFTGGMPARVQAQPIEPRSYCSMCIMERIYAEDKNDSSADWIVIFS
jgi:hypothetical protein